MALLSTSKVLLALTLLGLSLPSAALAASPALTGREWVHTVQPKDTLSKLAARHGLDLRRLLAINSLTTRKPLKAGQRLHLSSRHVAPDPQGAHLVVNIPDGLLYRYASESVTVYAVGLGEPLSKEAKDPKRWQTPTGRFTVVEKRKDPVWTVPPSIQEELRAAGKEVLTKVAPGPKNPLGTRWIGLSAWGYGIHGTNVPASIGRYSTHGCIRMRSEHVEEIFEAVTKGTVVRIAYEPAKVVVTEGAVYLEVGRDVYRRIPDMQAHVEKLLRDHGVWSRVDPAHVKRVVKARWGLAVRVDRGAPVPFATLAATPSPNPASNPAFPPASTPAAPATSSQETP